MAKKQKPRNGKPDLFDVSLFHATESALIGWYSQYVHDLIESNPEFRRQLNQQAAAFFEGLAKAFRERE